MKLGLIVATVVLAGGVLAVIFIDGESDQQSLSAADRAKARRLVSTSADLKRILRDRYAVKSIGTWEPEALRRDPGLADELTPVQVTVDPPRTVRAHWAYIGELRPCRRHWVPLTVRDLREVSVFVDLSESVVAAIVPSRSSGLSNWAVPARADSSCI